MQFLTCALFLLSAVQAILAAPTVTLVNSTVLPVKRASNVYKVRNLSGQDLTGRFGSGFSDLGIPARTPNGHMLFVAGDTFANNVGGPNWRSPVGFISSNPNLDSLNIDGAVGGNPAVGLVPEGHVAVNGGHTTAIPSDVFTANGKMYMNLMRGVIYKTDHTDFWVSNDNGNSWQFLNIWQGSQLNYAFQQKTFADGGDGYIYCLATVFNRDLVSDLLLHRIPIGSIEVPSTWQPWGFRNGAWAWGNPATTIAQPRKWGEISFRKVDNKFVFTWFNPSPNGIHAYVMNSPLDNLFAAQEQVLIIGAPSLQAEFGPLVSAPYGGFIFPGSTLARMDICVSQWDRSTSPNTYRFMQFRVENVG